MTDKQQFCGKHQHKTQRDASQAMRKSFKARKRSGLRSKRDNKKGLKVNTYLCKICGFWHWGHRR